MYQMTEGIDILNEKTGEVGKAIEYDFSSFLVYRYMKEPNVVIVEINGERKVWFLKDCRPKD